MRDERRQTGQQGEDLAAAYLRRQGYGIIARNWRCAAGELDLVAIDGATLVFVEVRTRRSAVAGLAEESVTRAKQRRLAALADAYLDSLAENGTPWDGAWRIDVIAIRLGAPTGAQLRQLRFAVEAF